MKKVEYTHTVYNLLVVHTFVFVALFPFVPLMYSILAKTDTCISMDYTVNNRNCCLGKWAQQERGAAYPFASTYPVFFFRKINPRRAELGFINILCSNTVYVSPFTDYVNLEPFTGSHLVIFRLHWNWCNHILGIYTCGISICEIPLDDNWFRPRLITPINLY